jgi:hypothetical protein
MALRRALPTFVVVALILCAGALAWPYTVDDAYIVARYATRWASGLGYTMNDGPPTDGVTGPAFTALVALGVLLDLDPIAVAKSIGLGSMAIAAALVVARIRGQAAGTYPAAWAALALGAQTTLSAWCVGGLETGVAALLVTAIALEMTRGAPRGAVVGLALFGLAWLRPDLAVFGAVGLLAIFSVSRREGAIALCIALLGGASVVGFRLALFGHPLPLSFLAKGGDPAHGLRYVVGGILLCTGGGGLVLVHRGARDGGLRYRFLALGLVAQAAAIVVMSGDWMPGYRLLAPTVPAYVLLAAQGLRHGQVGLSLRRTMLVAAALAVAVPAADLAVQIPIARSAGAMRGRQGDLVSAALVRSCERVATVDVGYLAYASRLEVVDLAGLTEPDIARLPGGHLDKHVGAAFLAARDPDCILLHSSVKPRVDALGRLRRYDGFPVEERIARDPWLWSRYRVESVTRFAPRYYYVLLLRRPAIGDARWVSGS